VQTRRWTPQLLRRLESLLEDGLSDREAAAVAGVSVTAIEFARREYGLLRRNQILMTSGQVARWLGCTSHAINDWAHAGFLAGIRRPGKGCGLQWFFTRSQVIDFLADPEHWHRWQPATIPDPLVRKWAEQQRGDVRFLTANEVADRLCCSVLTVHSWVQRGWLRCYRGQRSLFREDDIARFTLPEIGQGTRKRSWEPCSACGDPGGRSRGAGTTPGRRDATRFGVTGKVCETCYVRLMRQARRQPQRAA
jgi:hypothetical protein